MINSIDGIGESLGLQVSPGRSNRGLYLHDGRPSGGASPDGHVSAPVPVILTLLKPNNGKPEPTRQQLNSISRHSFGERLKPH